MASSPMAGVVALAAAVTLSAAVVSACGDATTANAEPGGSHALRRPSSPGSATAQAATPQAGEQVEVPPPPLSDGIFPCSDCHVEPNLPPNRTRRVLVDAHDDIVLRHDERQRWCLDCHDAVDRDRLHLASGELVPFGESYRVCGQCHGEKYRDWRAGVHGRRTGEWNGRKEYQLCVHCHDPHAPKFKPLTPEPAPLRPQRTAITR